MTEGIKFLREKTHPLELQRGDKVMKVIAEI